MKKLKTSNVPKLNVARYLTEDALGSVAGRPGIYAIHTDGKKCDTSGGCKCKS